MAGKRDVASSKLGARQWSRCEMLLLVLVSALAVALVYQSSKTCRNIEDNPLLRDPENWRWDRLNQSTLAKIAKGTSLSKPEIHAVIKHVGLNGLWTRAPESCHAMGHMVGFVSAHQTLNIDYLMDGCRKGCLGGCFHGLIEGYLIVNLKEREGINLDTGMDHHHKKKRRRRKRRVDDDDDEADAVREGLYGDVHDTDTSYTKRMRAAASDPQLMRELAALGDSVVGEAALRQQKERLEARAHLSAEDQAHLSWLEKRHGGGHAGDIKQVAGGNQFSWDRIRPYARALCTNDRVHEYFSEGECAHAVGHALVMLTPPFSNEENIVGKPTIIDRVCRMIWGDRPLTMFYCAGGTYMQGLSAYKSAYNIELKALKAKDSSMKSVDIHDYLTGRDVCQETLAPAACYFYLMRKWNVRKLELPSGKEKSGDMLNAVRWIQYCVEAVPIEKAGGRVQRGCIYGAATTAANNHANRPHLPEACSKDVLKDADARYACIDGWMCRAIKYYPTAVQTVCPTLKDSSEREHCVYTGSSDYYDMDRDISTHFPGDSPADGDLPPVPVVVSGDMAHGDHEGHSGHGEDHSAHVADVSLDREYLDQLHVIHGCLMMTAWTICAVSGLFASRYLKPLTDSWFPIHRALMVLVGVLTLSATGVMYYCTGLEGETHFESTHGLLGAAITLLTLFQATLGFLADKWWEESRTSTPFWPDGVHMYIGYGLPLVANCNVVLGVSLFTSRAGQTSTGVALAWAFVGAALLAYGYFRVGDFSKRSQAAEALSKDDDDAARRDADDVAAELGSSAAALMEALKTSRLAESRRILIVYSIVGVGVVIYSFNSWMKDALEF